MRVFRAPGLWAKKFKKTLIEEQPIVSTWGGGGEGGAAKFFRGSHMVFKGEPKAGVSNLPLTNTWVFLLPV